jgi:hypothetical protein
LRIGLIPRGFWVRRDVYNVRILCCISPDNLLLCLTGLWQSTFGDPRPTIAYQAKAGTMLIIDKLRRRESKDETLSLRSDQVDTGHFVSRKIIDFESARRALERDRLMCQNGEKSKRTFLSNLTDRSSVAESLVTIVLVLIIALSLLFGMIWGF